jgi:hypothetical protein
MRKVSLAPGQSQVNEVNEVKADSKSLGLGCARPWPEPAR